MSSTPIPPAPPLSQTVSSRLQKAHQITAEQIRMAKDLTTANFGMGANPAILAAVIQALATNYSATVQANSQ